MAIDNGPSVVEKLVASKYVKPTTQGFLLTKEGIEWLTTGLQELYHEITKLHAELDYINSVKHPVSNTDYSSESCEFTEGNQDDSIQPEQDE